MHRMHAAGAVAVAFSLFGPPVSADEPVLKDGVLHYPENGAIPRNLTPIEQAYLDEYPLSPRGSTPPPTGPIHCVPEYEPMEGLIITWEGWDSTVTNVLTRIAKEVTVTAGGKIYCYVDSTSERTSAQSTMTTGGVNLANVQFIVRTTDTIWCRDFGPRYIYQGDCRAIIDHEYNRPRPNDNALPSHFSGVKGHAYYLLDLIHGGGNFHLNGVDEGFATRLITQENPSKTESQIIGIWQSYQNLATTLYNRFPTSIDSTGHIDMWMQVIGDNEVIISDWPANQGSSQDVICESAVTDLTNRGWTVHRIPARNVGGTHYTYTNAVMFNDIVLIPSYTNSTIVSAGYNTQARSVWMTACPDKTIIQFDGQPLVTSAGVFHCIVMHVPQPQGGANPTAYLKTQNSGETYDPGNVVAINWISDDDVDVVNADILLSVDGGANFDTVIASATADDGAYSWTVPDVYTTQARIRVVTRDAAGNTGHDDSDANFTINGTPVACDGDLDGDGSIGLADLSTLLQNFGASSGAEPEDGDLDGDGDVDLADLSALLEVFGTNCP